MVDFGWRRNGFDFDDGVEKGRLGTFHSAQRNLLEVRHDFDSVFRVLHGEHIHIGIPALGIDPIIRRDHAVRSESGDDVVDDFLLRKTEEARFLPVNVEFEGRVVDVLGNQHVVYVLELAHGLSKLRSGVVDRVEVVAADLNVDWRGQTKIDHRVDQAAGLKVSAELREFLAQLLADPAHVFIAADFVVFFQADLNEGGVRRGVWSIDGGEIGGDADVRDDDLQFARRDDTADDLFHFLDVVFGQFDARS